MTKTTGLVLVGIAMFLSVTGSARGERCITTQADAIFTALQPLTKTCSRVGPASARWYLEGSLWNDFSHDQQQLMDQVASKEAIQAAKVTIHIFVYSTEVGEIGPGWSGEWKFRRKKD